MAKRIPARMISPRRLSARIDCILSLKRCARRLAEHTSLKSPFKKADGQTDGLTLFEHTLLNILALSKIDERLDKRKTADDLFAKGIEFRPRLSLQPNGSKQRICALRRRGIGRTHPCDAQRRTPLCLRLGVHEIQQPLDLREIEPAALERAARKLARCGGATPRDARERGKHCTDDGASAVHV